MKAIEDDFRVTTGFLAWRDALILIMRFQTMKIQDEYCKSKSGKNFKAHLHIEFPLQKANHRTFSLNEESAVTANKVITTQKKPSHNHFLHNIVVNIKANEVTKQKRKQVKVLFPNL